MRINRPLIGHPMSVLTSHWLIAHFDEGGVGKLPEQSLSSGAGVLERDAKSDQMIVVTHHDTL